MAIRCQWLFSNSGPMTSDTANGSLAKWPNPIPMSEWQVKNDLLINRDCRSPGLPIRILLIIMHSWKSVASASISFAVHSWRFLLFCRQSLFSAFLSPVVFLIIFFFFIFFNSCSFTFNHEGVEIGFALGPFGNGRFHCRCYAHRRQSAQVDEWKWPDP